MHSSARFVDSYRPDIDGLRAVAVLSVILFHLHGTLLPGGYIGVDVFFVISGFLITRNICHELEAGRFSIVEFYRRRVKRIAPAMLLVVLVTLIASQVLLLPDDARAAAKSAVFALLSLANVFFWHYQDSGYFAPNSAEVPLLHLWSLGVEEQFYFVWPILLIAFYRASSARTFMLVALAAAIGSFYFGQALLSRDASFSYYMLPSRAGELLLGALVAVASLRGVEERFPRALIAPTAILGSALLSLSLLCLSEKYSFPGWLALPPTIGTALIILAGHCGGSGITRLLAIGPMVWVGKISYSAYLWHWPLAALFRYGYGTIGNVTALVMFALTLGMAWLSYRYLEEPLRRSTAPAQRVFVVQYGLPAGAIAIIALVCMYPSRLGITLTSPGYQARLEAVQNRTRPAYELDWVCQRQRLVAADVTNEHCVIGPSSAISPPALLWGDSNAAHYIGILQAFAVKGGFRFRNIEIGSCPPLHADPTPFVETTREADCRASLELMKSVVQNYSVVIIGSNWPNYQNRSATFLHLFFDDISRLTKIGKLIILLGKVPEIEGYQRLCRQKALSYPILSCPTDFQPVSDNVRDINLQLRRFAASTPNVKYFDATSFICPQNRCSSVGPDGEPQYYDHSHLSVAASARLGQEILARDGLPAPFSGIADWPRAAISSEHSN